MFRRFELAFRALRGLHADVVQIFPFRKPYIITLSPILRKLHILAQLIESFLTAYGSWSCVEEKWSSYLYPHALSWSNEEFLSFLAKTFESRIFLFLQASLAELHT